MTHGAGLARWLQVAALAASGAAVMGQPGEEGSAPLAVAFVEAARDMGVRFEHVSGASPDKHLVETMGSGGLFFDYDDDGWIDLFLVDGGSLADPAVARRARHRLYRNRGGSLAPGTPIFEDVTAASGIRHSAYGMGACAGDVDGDGRVDLYVTNLGPNVLYRNRPDGTFADITREAGVGTPLWSAGCAFADFDGDGDLDLFVVNYLDADPAESPFCGNARQRTRFYCHPLNYEELPNTLYRNEGGGRFTDVTGPSGVGAHPAYGLGVVVSDFDDDGRPDVFVANDSVPNSLFRNAGDWRFDELGLEMGVAVATDGRPRAGMGTDAGDYDGDGHLDLVVTNLDFETHSLFRGLGDRQFQYATAESGIGFATLPFVGFGVAFFDADNDMRLDLAIANGHLMDNAPQFRAGATHAQRNLFFHNAGAGRFVEAGAGAGPGFALEKVSRGLVAGDVDNDGDLDLLVTNNGQAVDLLRNDGGSRRNALLVRVVGRRSNREGIGAKLRVTVGADTQVREVRAGSSYLGQHDPRVHFGLGTAARVDRLEVHWPGGGTDVLRDLPANQVVTVGQGEGLLGAVPFAR